MKLNEEGVLHQKPIVFTKANTMDPVLLTSVT